ncbi:MAG: hypothetical protein HKN56_02950 [Gammaproteobacteria bacterium]|nr:hypothetical protein [Gammaproteobacteria bacterium]
MSALAILSGCTSSRLPPLTASADPIDINRFMGDWYVVGSIPIDFPFASEAGAHNAVETYQLKDDGSIDTTYRFRRDSFDGKLVEFNPTGFLHNAPVNTEWRMQFIWPFKSAYLVAWAAPDYSETIIGVPNRRYVWLMARDYRLSEDDYQLLVDRAAAMGYEAEKIQRIPHRWPEKDSPPTGNADQG